MMRRSARVAEQARAAPAAGAAEGAAESAAVDSNAGVGRSAASCMQHFQMTAETSFAAFRSEAKQWSLCGFQNERKEDVEVCLQTAFDICPDHNTPVLSMLAAVTSQTDVKAVCECRAFLASVRLPTRDLPRKCVVYCQSDMDIPEIPRGQVLVFLAFASEVKVFTSQESDIVRVKHNDWFPVKRDVMAKDIAVLSCFHAFLAYMIVDAGTDFDALARLLFTSTSTAECGCARAPVAVNCFFVQLIEEGPYSFWRVCDWFQMHADTEHGWRVRSKQELWTKEELETARANQAIRIRLQSPDYQQRVDDYGIFHADCMYEVDQDNIAALKANWFQQASDVIGQVRARSRASRAWIEMEQLEIERDLGDNMEVDGDGC